MTNPPAERRVHVFPANGCRCERIEASDPFMLAAGVRPESPISGRTSGRPDDSLSPWTLTIVPPVKVEDTGERCYLALCKHGTPRALVVATTDDEAIAATRAIHPKRLVLADVAIGGAGRASGVPVVTLGETSIQAVATMALTTAIFRRREDMEAADEPSRFSRGAARFAGARLWLTPVVGRLLEVEATDHGDYHDRWALFLAGPKDLFGVALMFARYEVPLRVDGNQTLVADIGSSLRMMVKFDRASGDLRELLHRAWDTDLIPLPISFGDPQSPVGAVPNAEEWRALTGALEALDLIKQGRSAATVDVRGVHVTVREHAAAVLVDGLPGGSC